MKIEKNNVKIEITETKDGKICIDITTSKEVVVNVGKEEDIGIDLIDFSLTDVVKRGKLNATTDLTETKKRTQK